MTKHLVQHTRSLFYCELFIFVVSTTSPLRLAHTLTDIWTPTFVAVNLNPSTVNLPHQKAFPTLIFFLRSAIHGLNLIGYVRRRAPSPRLEPTSSPIGTNQSPNLQCYPEHFNQLIERLSPGLCCSTFCFRMHDS